MMSYDEAEDSLSDNENLKFRALPVSEVPRDFDPRKPPTSAEEYLHQVMWEAKQYDDVVTVKLDQSRIKKQSAVVRPNTKEVAPPGYAPSGETQGATLQQFLQTRRQVEKLRMALNKPPPPVKLPTSNNPDHWCQLCFGNAFQRSILLKQQEARSAAAAAPPVPSSSSSNSSSRSSSSSPSSHDDADTTAATLPRVLSIPEPVEGQQPLMSILLNIKQATLQKLTEWHVGWLEVAGFSEHQGKWLYSLLACLEKPLTPELCDNVRQMVFLCARARARLDSPSHPFLAQLNLIITIVTRFFNQEDLADSRDVFVSLQRTTV